MQLLLEENLIARLEQRLSPGVKVWRITDEGRSELAES